MPITKAFYLGEMPARLACQLILTGRPETGPSLAFPYTSLSSYLLLWGTLAVIGEPISLR
ncbi:MULTISPECIES: hypothetical protein [Methylobacter]|uniref:hypothetical protein n=1 Tax=Methylobacter TaxID=429 RepID=UPI0003A1EEFF|nr:MULTISPECIES: hypothetical protein [Methylobacter]